MATRTSVGTGLWSVAGTWDTGVPVDTDTAIIANGHTVTFDVDQSGMAAGITLTINAGGTLQASTSAGSYYLKLQNADMTVNGTLQAGTSVAVPYPSTATFTIDHSNNAKSIEVGAAGHNYLYCTQPTNRYITITEALDAVETEIDVGTDVTADTPWIAGAEVKIVDSTPTDVETRTIAGGGVSAGHIDITAALTNTKTINSRMILLTRNIRIINVAASDYAITYAATAGSGDHIGAEISDCYRGISGGTGYTFSGTMDLLTTSVMCIYNASNVTVSGCICGSGTTGAYGCVNTSNLTLTSTGFIGGFSTGGIASSTNANVSGLMLGNAQAFYNEHSVVVTTTGQIIYNSNGFQGCGNVICYGTVSNNTIGFNAGSGLVLSCSMSSNSTADLSNVCNGQAYNALFGSGTEFSGYAGQGRAASDYMESFDHDQSTNAFKAWCRGGIVTSQTASPPTGYDIWYEHACEDTTPEYPCFRQYESTVLPGQAIEVEAVIRIQHQAGLDDFSGVGEIPPRLQIIDKFADPLVDSTQTALDQDIIGSYDGTNHDWQNVSVIWANQGDAPRQVIVRLLAYSQTGGQTDIDEAWAVATYQDQISDILTAVRPLATTVATANTASSFTLTAGEPTADAYNNMVVMVQDADDDHWETRHVSDWTAGRVITVSTAFSFMPAVSDVVWIMGPAYASPVDLSSITAKLPTNYIMGSSDQDNHDTDIDAILVDTGTTLPTLIAPLQTTVASATSATVFVLTAGLTVADAYNGMLIMLQDLTDNYYEVRRIKDYTAAREVTVDTAFGFTPAALDPAYIMGTSYSGGMDALMNYTRSKLFVYDERTKPPESLVIIS